MPDRPPYYLTTPIYYVNARPHLGTAYSTIVTDTIARYKRAQGFDVFFLTGTDEHGQKIQRSAKTMNCTPQHFVDEVSAEFRALWDKLGLTYTDFIRTTEPRHKQGVQRLFTLLKERGYIYKGTYTGQYCVSDEAWVDVGPGEPCPDCGRITETVTEENYFFKLSAFERKLLELYEQKPDFIRPETRRNEVLSFVRGGLRDLSISRTSFSWGIPVPDDEKHVVYVWMDALANYITALGWGSDDDARFRRYWPADVHIIGKEISRFHCVYWPAFLMAAGLPLPKSIFAHGWLLFKDSKMSKSVGNIVRAETIHDVLGNDALRYFLLREVVFGQDGNFSFDALVERYNADLANGYGNLVSRTLAMITRYFDGVVPTPSSQSHLIIDAKLSGYEAGLRQLALDTIQQANHLFDEFSFSRALESIWQLVAWTDGFISERAPWKIAGDENRQVELADVLYACAESIRIITALVAPVLPDAAAKVWQQLGLGDIAQADLKNIAWGALQPGTKLGEAAPLFPRAEKDAVTRMKEIEENRPQSALEQALASIPTVRVEPAAGTPSIAEKADTTAPQAGPKPVAGAPLNPAAPAASTPTTPGQITIDDFAKVELRVAQVKVAERVPKADKLLRLEVDLGTETRQILAGIAESYEPESLIGRKVIVVANLAPRKLRGLESNGMLLAGSIEGGKAVLASFLEDVPLGAKVK